MSGAFETAGNPVGIVLAVQPLIVCCSRTINPRISPSIQQVSAFAALAPCVSGSFTRGSSMVKNPDLAEVAKTHEYLIEIGVIRNRIEMRPVRIGTLPCNHVVIDVDSLRMRPNLAKVVLVFVDILDEVIPEMPFPDNFSAGLPHRLDFNEAIGLHLRALGTGRNAASRNGFGSSFLFFHDHENVSVGQAG